MRQKYKTMAGSGSKDAPKAIAEAWMKDNQDWVVQTHKAIVSDIEKILRDADVHFYQKVAAIFDSMTTLEGEFNRPKFGEEICVLMRKIPLSEWSSDYKINRELISSISQKFKDRLAKILHFHGTSHDSNSVKHSELKKLLDADLKNRFEK